MPEASQFAFSHKEIVELLIKKADLHEGQWMLQIVFGFAAINGGPTPEQISPTAMVQVQTIGLQKAPADAPPALVLDAAEVNPLNGKPKRKKP